MNINSLKARVNNLVSKTNVPHNTIYKMHFFDMLIKKISLSEYRDKFVFKGGFYLSSLIGIQSRTTIDIDFSLRNEKMELDNIINIFNEIISIPIEDNVEYKILEISKIREDDIYGGFQIKLQYKFENLKDYIYVDVATGDPITPSSINYQHKTIILNESINLRAYNLETYIAEKVQTILSKGVLTSRLKDYYDLYIISKLKWDDINEDILNKAFINTCNYRRCKFEKTEVDEILIEIINSSILEQRWNAYSKKNSFAKELTYQEIVNVVKRLINIIYS